MAEKKGNGTTMATKKAVKARKKRIDGRLYRWDRARQCWELDGAKPPVAAEPPGLVLAKNLQRRDVQAAIGLVLVDVVLPILAVLGRIDEAEAAKEPKKAPSWAPPPAPEPPEPVAARDEQPLIVERKICNCPRCSARRTAQGVN